MGSPFSPVTTASAVKLMCAMLLQGGFSEDLVSDETASRAMYV